MDGARILWRRLDRPGHEHAELRRDGAAWSLRGVALFAHEQQSCRLDYEVVCDEAWSTVSATVSGSIGDSRIDAEVRVRGGHWKLNGEPVDDVEGCIDVDLNFSPSTNLLPVRRLHLGVGEEAGVRAAWLRFPSFALEPLEQKYRRIADRTYRYESAGGRFVAEINVGESGLPQRYGDIWRAED